MRNTLESAMLEMYGRKVREEGCEFIVDPQSHQLPEQVAQLRPDAIVICPSERRLVIARSLQDDTADIVTKYNEALTGTKEWKFVLLWANELIEALDYIDATTEEVLKSASELKRIPEDLQDTRLLSLYAMFERVARVLIPVSGRVSLSSLSLVEAIAAAGVITPSQADDLRVITRKRNALNHGAVSDPVTAEELSTLLDVITEIANLMISDVKETKDRLTVALAKLQAAEKASDTDSQSTTDDAGQNP